MRRLLGVFAALALLAAGAFSFARISAAQDDPELAARASEYVEQKFGISGFFSDANEAGRERRVHQMVLFPEFGTYPMIVWGEWHGDWKVDQFGLERQRYVGYSLQDESVTNPMFPPDSQGSGPLDAQNWIPFPWKSDDVRQQHPDKIKNYELDGNPDPEIVSRLQDGLMFTAWFNGYDFPARDSDLYLNPQKYVHIYIPPAPNVWGMGVMFRYKGQSVWYVSVPLGPPVPDCGVRLEPSERQAKPGDAVSFTLKVSFRKMYDSHLGGRVYLSHKVGENAYPVPFSLDGRQSETDAQLGAAYLDVVPGGDRDYQAEVTVHAQDVGSTLVAWVVPGWRTDAGEFRFLEGYDSDPSHNRAEAKIIVDQPNLKVRNLTLDPNPASPGDAVQARAEIVNEGSQDVTTLARWIFNDQVVAEQEVWIPAGGYNVTQARIQAPDESGTYAVGILANPNRDRPANEKTWDDNYAEGYLEVRRLASPGSDGLTLQAWFHPGTDLYGEWRPARKRPVNTAKWSDDVKATLRVARPVPPRGRLDWWEISSAKLTYPRQNPDFTFGCPYPPSGTVTVNMRLPGRAGPGTDWLEATAEFEENWAMDGFPVYCMLEERQMTTERPKAYPVTATYTVRYQYTYVVCGNDGCETITATDSYTRTARQDLLVNGAGTILYGS